MFAIRIFFLTVFLQTFTISECLRCAIDCPWDSFPLNTSIPFEACRHEERAHAECSVSVQIDFKESVTHGQLYMNKYWTTAQLLINTNFFLQTNSVKSMIFYSCAMSDYCDHTFLDELATDKLAEFNYTNIYQKLRNLLYTSTTNKTDIQCFDRTCPSDSFCQVTLNTLMSPKFNKSEIYGNVSCRALPSSESFLDIYETYLVSHTRLSGMVLRCNTNQCGTNKTVFDVYNVLRNEFVIPLNYSILDMDDIISISTKLSPSIFAFFFLFISIKILF